MSYVLVKLVGQKQVSLQRLACLRLLKLDRKIPALVACRERLGQPQNGDGRKSPHVSQTRRDMGNPDVWNYLVCDFVAVGLSMAFVDAGRG